MKAMNKLDAFRESLKFHPIIIIDNGNDEVRKEKKIEQNEMTFSEWEAWVAWNAWEAWVAWNADEHER